MEAERVRLRFVFPDIVEDYEATTLWSDFDAQFRKGRCSTVRHVIEVNECGDNSLSAKSATALSSRGLEVISVEMGAVLLPGTIVNDLKRFRM